MVICTSEYSVDKSMNSVIDVGVWITDEEIVVLYG